jgi:hypothetical protein
MEISNSLQLTYHPLVSSASEYLKFVYMILKLKTPMLYKQYNNGTLNIYSATSRIYFKDLPSDDPTRNRAPHTCSGFI